MRRMPGVTLWTVASTFVVFCCCAEGKSAPPPHEELFPRPPHRLGASASPPPVPYLTCDTNVEYRIVELDPPSVFSALITLSNNKDRAIPHWQLVWNYDSPTVSLQSAVGAIALTSGAPQGAPVRLVDTFTTDGIAPDGGYSFLTHARLPAPPLNVSLLVQNLSVNGAACFRAEPLPTAPSPPACAHAAPRGPGCRAVFCCGAVLVTGPVRPAAGWGPQGPDEWAPEAETWVLDGPPPPPPPMVRAASSPEGPDGAGTGTLPLGPLPPPAPSRRPPGSPRAEDGGREKPPSPPPRLPAPTPPPPAPKALNATSSMHQGARIEPRGGSRTLLVTALAAGGGGIFLLLLLLLTLACWRVRRRRAGGQGPPGSKSKSAELAALDSGGPAAKVQIAAWSNTRRAWGLWGRSGPPPSPEGAERPWERDAEQGWAEGAPKGPEQGAGVELAGHLGTTDTLGVCLSQRTLSLPSLATAPEAEALRLARHPGVLTLVEGRRGEAVEGRTSSALQRSLSSPPLPEQGGRGGSSGSAAPSSKPSRGKRSGPGSKPGSKPRAAASSSHAAPPPKAPSSGALDSSKQVVLHEQLGSGAFGTVYRGEWRGRAVAVKVLQTAGASSHSKELDSFRREVEVLSRLKHPHIISFLAASTVPPTICIVEELAAGGSLYARLHGQSGAHRARPLPYSTLLGVALGVAEAMEYLHPHVVHRDLKSQNVLLDEGGRALVCDFGIAKFKDRTFLSTANGQAGTPAYMAPEMFDGAGISEKVDVFSFAVLLWEMLTGQVPWAHVPSPMQIIYYVGVMGQRLPLPDSCPRGLRDLIVRCWSDEPEARPRFASIVPWLRAETVRVQRKAGGAGKGLGPQTLQALQGQPSYALSEEEEEEEEEFGSKASPSKGESQAQPATSKGSFLSRSPRRGHASPLAALAPARSSGSASPSSPPPPDRPLSPGLAGFQSSAQTRRGPLGAPGGASPPAPFAPGPLSAAHAKRVLAEGERTEPETLAAPRTALSVLIASSLARPDPGEGSGVPCSPLQSALLSPASPRTGV